jgi:hypothetical protein
MLKMKDSSNEMGFLKDKYSFFLGGGGGGISFHPRANAKRPAGKATRNLDI